VTVATLLADADAVEAADPRYLDELATWRRDRDGAEDGIPRSAAEWESPDRVSDVPLRDFTASAHQPGPDAGRPPQVERDSLFLLGSDGDTHLDWLRAGRALGLVMLALTDAGIVTQPLGPVTDVPATRARLQRELGLLGHAQLMLRAGYGHGRPRSGRRHIDKTLTVALVP
jgi:hypothetical protein